MIGVETDDPDRPFYVSIKNCAVKIKKLKKKKKKWTSERKRGFNFFTFLALHVEQQTDNLEMFLRKTLTAIFLLAIIFLFCLWYSRAVFGVLI